MGGPPVPRGLCGRTPPRVLSPGANIVTKCAAILRDGQAVEKSETAWLTAGRTTELQFDFSAQQPAVTTLTLHVPQDAEVVLAGHETKTTGSQRVFQTTKLCPARSGLVTPCASACCETATTSPARRRSH